MFGIEEYPKVLLLDWNGTTKLDEVGDKSAAEVAAALERALNQ